ncbi:PAS domain S-box protein [Pedobacter sp. ASV1-7]|uniref:PAS domain-containing protein n=1 Tax=Pedobacter sp. ASV1-7 TaxID=3145237 RepID=UPI0032E85FD5
MFNQKVLIVKENEQIEGEELLNNQLVSIGWPESQIISCSGLPYHIDRTQTYEAILFLTENIDHSAVLVSQLHNDFPLIPVIIITNMIPSAQIIPDGADDWLLRSWLEPLLLKKTIQLARHRRQNMNNYMDIFKENPSPMYIYEEGSYSFLEVNLTALKQYGYTKSEFLQLTAKDIRPESELEAFYKVNEELPPDYLNAGIWIHTRKNREDFYVHIFTHRIIFGGKACKLVMALDIDDDVKADLAIKQKAAEVENILESITDAFYTVNKNWEFTYINKSFERILKRTREELLGKVLWEAFPDTVELDYYNQYHKAVNEKVSVHFEEFYPFPPLWFSVNAYPTHTGLAVYLMDITDQKNYQQKIEKQNRQFKEIAWVQAHQIRGPVSNLMGLVDLFNVEQHNDPENLELLARIKHTAIQMDESIKEIVSLTQKLES